MNLLKKVFSNFLDKSPTQLSELSKYVEKTNKKFDEASPAKKRLMIVKDTLLRLKLKNFTLKKGHIFDSYYTGPYSWHNDYELKEVLNNKPEIKCTVCAKGALFCSLIGRINNFKIEKIKTEIIDSKLVEYFGYEQTDLIETAFEGNSYMYHDNLNNSSSYYKKSKEFASKYSDITERMIAICENIIKNKGTFKP